MGKNSDITWCDHTFNPWIGCTKVSPACDHCYAEARDIRFQPNAVRWGPHAPRTRTKTWGNPVRWNKQAEDATERPRVFCASLADVFDNHKSILPEWRHDLWKLIKDTPNLDWLLLTKRPQNIQNLCPWTYGTFPDNVWIGTTVEDQKTAEQRLWHLCQIPCRVRFISAEPLIGDLNLTEVKNRYGDYLNALTGEYDSGYVHQINWVITGGESGSQYRPANPDWFRVLRDQCKAENVPFLFKQWEGQNQNIIKAKGRELDGVIHDGYPK